jgi:hypothetical protein
LGQAAPEPVAAGHELEFGAAVFKGARFGDFQFRVVALQLELQVVRVLPLVVELDDRFAGRQTRSREGEG